MGGKAIGVNVNVIRSEREDRKLSSANLGWKNIRGKFIQAVCHILSNTLEVSSATSWDWEKVVSKEWGSRATQLSNTILLIVD